MSSSGVVRVTIPVNLHKTIQDIKEIASKHSDEDIYAMLKECNMDPNETAQKLLYLDTFHEVKRKRDRKKPNVSVRAPQRYRWTSGVQQHGAGSRGKNSSTHVSDDNGGSRQFSAGQENGVTDQIVLSSNALVPDQQNNAAPHITNSLNDSANGATMLPNGGSMQESNPKVSADDVADGNERAAAADVMPNGGSMHESNPKVSADDIADGNERAAAADVMPNGGSMHESNPKFSADDIADGNERAAAADVSKSGKRPTLPSVDVKQLQGLNPGPTPAPTPTVASGASFEGRDSGVYSSASDPVLVPSLNPRNPGSVGAIKRETGSQRTAPDSSGMSLPESRLNFGQDVVNNTQGAPRTMISSNKTSQGVEKSQNSDASGLSSLLNHDNSSVSITHQDSWSTQQVYGASKLMTSEGEAIELRANVHSFPKVSDASLGQATSQLEVKLEKLNLSTHQPVIFPDHIQVPEAYRIGLTFGSLDDTLVHSKTDSQDTKHVGGTVMRNEDAAREPSLSHQTTSSIAREGDYPGHSQPHPQVPENLSPLEVNITSGIPLKSDQSKPESLQPVGGLQYPFLHAASDYSFGFMPPLLGPHLVQVDGAEVGNSSIPSTSGSPQPPTQTVGVGQTSVAVSPQSFAFLRQPYPSNYFLYNLYFPQIYMPHNAPQFLGHSGFPLQASTGNIYMPPSGAPAGAKFPVPPLCKPGVATSLTHFGFPSAYGSYGSSAVGYCLGASMTPGSSASNEDLTAPELKEKNIYPTVKQNEESRGRAAAPGRDLSALPANFFYNFPQGQQVAFSPAHSSQGSLAGMYHLSPTTASPSIVQSIPQHSQAMAPSVEPVVPPSGTYQQPHSQINWNPKLLNRESI